jgi:transposase
MDVTDDRWAILPPILPAPWRRADGRGRPWRDAPEVLNGIRWLWRTGAPWKDLPERYPPDQTCYRRCRQWVRSGVVEHMPRALATALRERGGLDLSECSIDGTFVLVNKSPSTVRVLRRLESPLLKPLSPSVLSMLNRSR